MSLKGNVEVAIHEFKQLSGLLPVCAWCHQVRDDEGYWQRIAPCLTENTVNNVTHSICPDCAERVKQDRVGL